MVLPSLSFIWCGNQGRVHRSLLSKGVASLWTQPSSWFNSPETCMDHLFLPASATHQICLRLFSPFFPSSVLAICLSSPTQLSVPSLAPGAYYALRDAHHMDISLLRHSSASVGALPFPKSPSQSTSSGFSPLPALTTWLSSFTGCYPRAACFVLLLQKLHWSTKVPPAPLGPYHVERDASPLWLGIYLSTGFLSLLGDSPDSNFHPLHAWLFLFPLFSAPSWNFLASPLGAVAPASPCSPGPLRYWIFPSAVFILRPFLLSSLDSEISLEPHRLTANGLASVTLNG